MSAYRDKLNPGQDWYHVRYGRDIALQQRTGPSRRTRGDDITFPEFISYIVRTGAQKHFFNEHWRPMYLLTYPCLVQYDFLGKLESFHDDALYVLQKAYSRTKETLDRLQLQHLSRKHNRFAIEKFYRDIPPEQLEKLAEIYALDFELFDYPTTPPGGNRTSTT